VIEPVDPARRDTARVSQEDVMQAWEYDVIYIDPNDLHKKQGSTPLATRALNRAPVINRGVPVRRLSGRL